MDTLKDLVDSLKDYLRGRLSNPLYAAYVIAWAVFNYKMILVLVGDGDWKLKIDFIDSHLYPDTWASVTRGLLYPFLAAVGYVMASPFVYRWVTVFVREREKATLTRLLQIAGETPMPPDVADRLQRDIALERQKRRDQEKASQVQIEQLNDQIEKLLEEVSSRSRGRIPTPRASVSPTSPTEDRDDSAEQRPVPTRGPFRFRAEDVVSGAEPVRTKLFSRGLQTDELELLLWAKDSAGFTLQDVVSLRPDLESYVATTLVERLEALKLIQRFGDAQFRLTPFGRDVLAAAKSRGYLEQFGHD